jgi:nucleotide-binding universal stress UspA family protein
MIEISTILCPVDFSRFSDHALSLSAAAARWYEARLTLLHVFPHLPAADMLPAIGLHATPTATLQDVGAARIVDQIRRRAARLAPGLDVTYEVVEAGEVGAEILAQADRLAPDLLVMASHGRSGVERLLLGSVTEQVLRRARCPVMVVPAHDLEPAAGGPRFRQILCPVDYSDSALRSLEFAYSLAEEADGQLTLLHVVEAPTEMNPLTLVAPPPPDEVLAAACAQQTPRLHRLVPDAVRTFCQVHEEVAVGPVAPEILRAARERRADLIVMGVMGRTPLDLTVFGSTTHKVLRGATCPVLTVRAR